MLKTKTHILNPNAAFKILNDVKIEYSKTEDSNWRRALVPTQNPKKNKCYI